MRLLTQVIKISSSFKGIMDAKMYHGIAVQGVKQAKKIFDGNASTGKRIMTQNIQQKLIAIISEERRKMVFTHLFNLDSSPSL